MQTNYQKIISASLLRLRMKSPFLATLALFARFVPNQQLPTAATDGKDIFFNPDYLLSLPSSQQDGLLLHEVLHAALIHVFRRGVRDAKLWNIAADIVVNGIIAQQRVFELPPDGLCNPKLEHLSVEEIYELLLKENQDKLSLPNPDLLDRAPEDASSSPSSTESNSSPSNNKNSIDSDESNSSQPNNKNSTNSDESNSSQPSKSNTSSQVNNSSNQNKTDSIFQSQKTVLEAHWKHALQQAAVIARTTSQGKLPAGIEREWERLTTPQLDWRTYLWRYLVQTPTDFMGFDRRFIGRGLYLETLIGESVRVYVAVDTSGSIDYQQLQLFLSEVEGILSAYPHLQCELYYVDAEAYGPHELNSKSSLPQPQGGGGTSFIPFFEQVNERWDRQTSALCIYLTDGYGSFPSESPELPVLWVVTPGGLELEQFPFGEAVQLLSIS